MTNSNWFGEIASELADVALNNYTDENDYKKARKIATEYAREKYSVQLSSFQQFVVMQIALKKIGRN